MSCTLKRRLGFVIAPISLEPGFVIEHTNQFEPGFEVFARLTVQYLKELYHPQICIHLVEFEDIGGRDVYLVEKATVLKNLGGYTLNNLRNTAKRLNEYARY